MEIPGDMHAKGYLCEAAFKAHSSGGLHKLLSDVMKRPKLTKEAFKKRKFEDNNLNRIIEGVRDASQSYGMAAVLAFECSSVFPSSDELKRTLQKYGNHNNVLLQRFKEWLIAFHRLEKFLSKGFRSLVSTQVNLKTFSTKYSKSRCILPFIIIFIIFSYALLKIIKIETLSNFLCH